MRTATMLVALAACSGVSSDPNDTRVVAGGLLRPGNVAVGGGMLYVVEQIDVGNESMYDLKRVPTDGSGFPQAVDTGHVITAIAADDSGAYWIDDSVGACTVKMFDGHQVRALGTPTTGIYCALRNLSIGIDAVYFADDLGQVWRLPKSGTGAVQIGTTDTTAGSVVADTTGVWVSTIHGVKYVSADGQASPENVLMTAMHVEGLALGDSALYAVIAGGSDGAVVRVHENGLFATLANVKQPDQLIAFEGTLYGAGSYQDDGVWAVPEASGDLNVLHDQGLYGNIAVDHDGIYWADPAAGQLVRIKP